LPCWSSFALSLLCWLLSCFAECSRSDCQNNTPFFLVHSLLHFHLGSSIICSYIR
jgi:hypothetical protein